MKTFRKCNLLAVLIVAICFVLPAHIVAQQPQLIVQLGHSDVVDGVAYSPDGKILASGSQDRTIKLWDVASGRELRTLRGHEYIVTSVTWSADGKTLASGGTDATIRLWDVASGRELRTLRGHDGMVKSVAWSADGKTLASGGWDATIKLWDAVSGRELRTLRGHEKGVLSMAWSPDGKTLVSGSYDNMIKLWDAASGRAMRTLRGNESRVDSVAWSADGKTLASGSASNIKLWDVASGQELRTLSGHLYSINSVAWSPDGKMLASASSDNTIKLWDAVSGRELRTLRGYLISSMAWSPDGKTLASGCSDATVKLWDVASGRELWNLQRYQGLVTSVAWSADGKRIASGGEDKTIKLWDIASGKELRTLRGHMNVVYSVAWSPDGKTLASGSFDETIKLWDVESGRELRTLRGDGSSVSLVAWSADGMTLASGGSDMIKLWDVASGQELRTLRGDMHGVSSVAWSADGKSLASGSVDNTIKLWDAASGQELRTLRGHENSVKSVAWNVDGKMLASGSMDDTIKLWDVASGLELRTLRGHGHWVKSVAWSGGGKMLASGSEDGTIKLWDLASGRELRTLRGHGGSVESLAWSADGKTLASGNQDRTIKLWDGETGDLLITLFDFENNDWAVVDAVGRFDASSGGMKHLHYVVGLTTISLEQMKESYYEPGLLSKLLGNNKQPVRDVPSLENVRLELFPEVSAGVDNASSRLTIKLTNQGGGIGRVQVFVNGKEFIADARGGQQVDSKAKQASITVNLANAPNRVPGAENKVHVTAWNTSDRGEYLRSNDLALVWNAPGEEEKGPASFYAIVGGVSTYSGEPEKKMNLNFPAVDAREIARLLKMAAEGLFTTARVKINLLASNPKASANGIQEAAPTKANFKRAFDDVARQAKAQDIVVVFLAGHGISFGNIETGKSEYGYLTQEASAPEKSAFANPAIRAQQLITGGELVEWNNKIAANKTVIILDTCEAGSAQKELLALLKERDVPADQIRALERLKDLTGLHVLMGAASNKASYETSTFGRGLLTHALTEGFSGPGLKNEKYVEVGQLFQYAQRRVEELARSFSEQRPHYLQGSNNFEIGLLEKADRDRVSPRKGLPLLLPPLLIEISGSDSLDLTESLRKELRLAAANNPDRDQNSKFRINAVYADLLDYADALQLRGTYSITANRVVMNLSITKNKVTVVEFRVEGVRTDTQGLMHRLMEAIEKEIDRIT